MKRQIIKKLVAWKQAKKRKPLILKGARQVGKTYELRRFAREHYLNHHYFNFEKEPKLATAFEQSLDPQAIIQALNFYRGRKINVDQDLIIFDEIQACPNALTSLKYFCEEMSHAHLCAAGSLLGLCLNEVSYPVGKVNHLEMFPMSFHEFLVAVGDDIYAELLEQLTRTTTIPTVAHQHLWRRLQHYFITGGLPEVVSLYVAGQEDLFSCFNQVRAKQLDLIDDYFSDIAKHSGKINTMHISQLWRSIPEQLAQAQDASATKFKFKGVIPGIDRYSKLVDALDWLEAAGLILKVNIVNKAALPLKAYAKANAFKLFLFDVGLLGALSEINPNTILNYDYGSYKGFFAENYVAQAFWSVSAVGLYSWTERTAEVEFVREVEGAIIPIEVKSGWVTQAKSLTVYCKKYSPSYRVILSAKPLVIDDQVQCLPLYLASYFPLSE